MKPITGITTFMTMWRRNDSWIGSHVDDSFVMINIDHGNYVALNATAAIAWEALAEPQDEDMLVAVLTEKFAVAPDDCRDAIRILLRDLTAKNLVTLVS